MPMLLRRWRKAQGMSLTEGARFFGLKSFSALSAIERGVVFASPESIVQIEGATQGEVTAADHMAAWRKANPQRFSNLRAAGRSAAKSYRLAARAKRRQNHG